MLNSERMMMVRCCTKYTLSKTAASKYCLEIEARIFARRAGGPERSLYTAGYVVCVCMYACVFRWNGCMCMHVCVCVCMTIYKIYSRKSNSFFQKYKYSLTSILASWPCVKVSVAVYVVWMRLQYSRWTCVICTYSKHQCKQDTLYVQVHTRTLQLPVIITCYIYLSFAFMK